MADPFAMYNEAIERFTQGGKTDLATLYAATDKLRQTTFLAPETTPLMSFYRDVVDRYTQKKEAAQLQEEAMRESIEKKYAAAEASYLSAAKAQWTEAQPTGGKLSNFLVQQERNEKLKQINEAKTIAEFKALVPGFSIAQRTPFASLAKREYDGAMRLLTRTGERKSAADVYKESGFSNFGKYAASLTDIEVFGSQATGAAGSLEAERLKLSKENERRQREFIETKQKLLESAEAISRAKRPAYTERPL